MMKLIVRHLQDSGRFASRFGGSCARPPVSCLRAMKFTTSTDVAPPPPPPPPPPPLSIGPIITFLSPSPQRSRSAVEFLHKLFHLPQIQIDYCISSLKSDAARNSSRRDCLDELHFGIDSSSSWDSIACACPTSGTILHFLSYHSAAEERKPSRTMDHGYSPLHLIAIQLYCNTHYQTAMIECRKRLAETLKNGHAIPHSFASTIEARLRGLIVYIMRNVMGRQPQPKWIIPGSPSTTPILDLTPFVSPHAIKIPALSNEDEHRHTDCGKLRELVLPYFPEVSSLQATLSQSSLSRPLTGLYQYPEFDKETGEERTINTHTSGLVVRPLPAAQEDLRLSPPSLVFQCKSLVETQTLVEEKLGGRTTKIGWRGNGHLGSLIVSHPSITGLDIRICETTGDEWVLSSSFDESQDSLLAGSLAELQSVHVVSEGRRNNNTEKTSGDKNTANGDCWIEVRTNAKHPAGFLKQLSRGKTNPLSVAKPPDIPYE